MGHIQANPDTDGNQQEWDIWANQEKIEENRGNEVSPKQAVTDPACKIGKKCSQIL